MSTIPPSTLRTYLVFRTAERLVGLALTDVEETLRPPALRPWPDAPPFVRGVAQLRGETCAVLDLGLLWGHEPSDRPARLVILRGGSGSRIGVLSDEVLGLHELRGEELPGLLSDARARGVEELGRLDGELLLLLGRGLLPVTTPPQSSPGEEVRS